MAQITFAYEPMAQIDFTWGLKEKLDRDQSIMRDIGENYVDYVDRDTGEIIVRVPRSSWERIK